MTTESKIGQIFSVKSTRAGQFDKLKIADVVVGLNNQIKGFIVHVDEQEAIIALFQPEPIPELSTLVCENAPRFLISTLLIGSISLNPIMREAWETIFPDQEEPLQPPPTPQKNKNKAGLRIVK